MSNELKKHIMGVVDSLPIRDEGKGVLYNYIVEHVKKYPRKPAGERGKV